MKREILFRGKSLNSNEWIESITVAKGTIKRKRDCVYLSVGDNVWRGVKPETVGQFTGLTVSKNHPMFDDRIKLWEDDVFTIGRSQTKFKVVFENYEWIGVSNEGDDWGKYKYRLSAIKESICILGNIHDNPEIFMVGGKSC